jgi:hypothetical protein
MRRQFNVVSPDGWLEHRLAAGIVPGGCSAIVQMFISKEWPAPDYSIILAHDSSLINPRAAAHSYRYYGDGDVRNGTCCGVVHRLGITSRRRCDGGAAEFAEG